MIDLPGEEDRSSFEQIDLQLEPSVPPPELTELLTLRAPAPVIALTTIQILLDPVPQRLFGHPKRIRHLLHRAA